MSIAHQSARAGTTRSATCSRTEAKSVDAASRTGPLTSRNANRRSASGWSSMMSATLRRSLVHAHVQRARGGERLAPPPAPSLSQPQAGEPGHEVELARPGVADRDRLQADPVPPQVDLMRIDPLLDGIVPADVEADVVELHVAHRHELVVGEPCDVGKEGLEYEDAVVGESVGDVVEATHLSFSAE